MIETQNLHWYEFVPSLAKRLRMEDPSLIPHATMLEDVTCPICIEILQMEGLLK